jgi:UDP-glucose 4-epimerase
MRVLVTGAAGFVGGAVTRRLVAEGHEVTALHHRREPADLSSRVACASADLLDAAGLHAIVEAGRFEGVCHLAALTRVRESFQQPLRYYSVNVQGTVNLLEALAQLTTPVRFVFASTNAVYGAPEAQPISEDQPPAPTSPYGASKLAADQVIGFHAATGAVGAVSLRCFNAAGAVGTHADQDLSRLIPKTLAVVSGRAPHLEVNGDGSAMREYLHVQDLADAFNAALVAAEKGRHRIFNVGSGFAVSIRDVIATAEEVTGRPVRTIERPPQPEPPKLVADSTRIRTELGWRPKRSALRQILADAWNAERQYV